MSSTTLTPGQSQDFHDHEGGTDLKVSGTAGQPFTTAIDGGTAKSRTVSADGDDNVFEVPDDQTMTVTNTSTTANLTVAFPAEAVSAQAKHKK